MCRLISRTADRIAIGTIAALLPVAATSATSATAAAANGPEQALEAICAASGGTLGNNPFQRVRCQQVPPTTMRDPLLDVAESLCQQQLDASFNAAPSFGTIDGSITWVCS